MMQVCGCDGMLSYDVFQLVFMNFCVGFSRFGQLGVEEFKKINGSAMRKL
jgi:hypothetical protein